jgi:hypothetical protein
MTNYKALKAAGKMSVKKQAKKSAVFNADGSIKTRELNEELQVVKKSFNSDTGEVLDDIVRAYSLTQVKSEIDRFKAEIVKIQEQQADLEQLETDLKAL